MPGSKPSVRLGDAEIWEFLGNAHTGILSSLRADGTPIMTPLWFTVLDRSVYFRTRVHLTKVRRLQRNPRCAFLVESGEAWNELKAVHLTGSAHFLDDADPLRSAIQDALDDKYKQFRTPMSEMPAETRAAYSRSSVFVEIVSDERILSWDNARLAEG